MSFFNDYLNWNIATEAEDITQEAQDAVQAALRQNTNTRRVDTDGDISTDTNDILGVKEDPDGGTPEDDTPTNEPDVGETEAPDDTDGDNIPNDADTDPDTPEDPNAEDSENTEDETGMDETDEPQEEALPTNTFENDRKKKCWYNMEALYYAFDNSINLLAKYVPDTNDAATIKVISDIKDNLMHAKEIAYNILTVEHNTLSYAEMEKKYVALNQILDLMTKELEYYFDTMSEDGKIKKKTNKK